MHGLPVVPIQDARLNATLYSLTVATACFLPMQVRRDSVGYIAIAEASLVVLESWISGRRDIIKSGVRFACPE